jgi:decaprenyl-phosphate phosphoribosyltransferase
MSALLELIRIRQWVKNGFVLAPLFFGKDLFHRDAVLHALTAVAVFCLASSAVYIFNDWRDIEADRVHALKKSRPLASGRIPVPAALALMLVLLAGCAAVIWLSAMPPRFWIIVGLYLVLNLGYSLGLKHVTVVELLLVSSGFVLRLLAGGVALAVALSPWIIIATGTIALLITTGKRRGDIARQNDVGQARKSLAGYNLAYLDGVLAALTGSTFVVFLLFCASDYAVARYGANVLITSVPVAAGLMRYLQLIIVYGDGDSPSDLVMRDKGLLASVLVFVAIFGVLIYRHWL